MKIQKTAVEYDVQHANGYRDYSWLNEQKSVKYQQKKYFFLRKMFLSSFFQIWFFSFFWLKNDIMRNRLISNDSYLEKL